MITYNANLDILKKMIDLGAEGSKDRVSAHRSLTCEKIPILDCYKSLHYSDDKEATVKLIAENVYDTIKNVKSSTSLHSTDDGDVIFKDYFTRLMSDLSKEKPTDEQLDAFETFAKEQYRITNITKKGILANLWELINRILFWREIPKSASEISDLNKIGTFVTTQLTQATEVAPILGKRDPSPTTLIEQPQQSISAPSKQI